MKTYTDKRIERNQDINNTWTLIAAGINVHKNEGLKTNFINLFLTVQDCNKWARQQEQDP